MRQNTLLLFLFGAVGLVFTIGHTSDYVMDDALITLRYSDNLADTGRPIWNKADAGNPVMGYTSPAWMLINTLTALVTNDKDVIVAVAKFYSLVALLALLALTCRWLTRLGYSTTTGVWLIFLLFWNPVVGLHVNSGMETVLFGVLTFLFAYQVLHRHNYYALLGTGILCYLTRPEGGLLVALYWALDFAKTRNLRRSLLGSAVALSAVGVYHWIAFRYYGDPLPLAFYVKQAYGSFFKIAAVKDTILFLVACALPFVIVTSVGYRIDRKIGTIVALGAALLLFFLTVEPQMNVAFRYQLPVLFLLWLTTVLAYPHVARLGTAARVPLYAVFALQWIFSFGVADMYAKKSGRQAENVAAMGKALAQRNDYRSWIAYADAGILCYYSDFNTVDLCGLNTRAIARGRMTPADVWRDPNVRVVFENARFKTEEAVRPRAEVDHLGLVYVGSVPVTKDEREIVVVQVYARDGFIEVSDIARIQVDPEYEESWFQSLYYRGRKILKGR